MDRHDPDFAPAHVLALAAAGGRIGLLGGSFNPAHGAHVHVSLVAMRRLKLDAVWWLVSPQNPLKPVAGMAPIETRLAQARAVARHPRILASAPESGLGTRFTADTVDALQTMFPRARFVWLMGGDSLAGFHRWRNWTRIAAALPLAVVARPGFTTRALNSVAGRRLAAFRVRQPEHLFDGKLPAWVFLSERLDPLSATALRAAGYWPVAGGGK
jgi:nicotinate-nucleotide adenylyltransferase